MPTRPQAVRVFEVGPRDGLQNEASRLSVEQKLDYVRRLADAGLRDIEIGAFVHPRWVPQMADTGEVAARLPAREGVHYWALVPNLRGLERAIESGLRHFGLLTSASEGHSRANLNRSIAEGTELNVAVARAAHAAGARLRGYISVAFGCPYEGDVPFDVVLGLAERYFEAGVDEVALGDTTGMASPDQVRAAARNVLRRYGPERIGFHFHDTRGLGLTNAYTVLEEGAVSLDSSTGGIGGCPYAPGASGNLATEDLLHMLDRLGVATGVDVAGVVAASRWLRDVAGVGIASKYFHYAASQGQSG